jgi:hypothetical protein
MRLMRPLLRIIKGIYDLLATYLLAWVLLFALLALGFQLLLHGAVCIVGDFASTETFWVWADRMLPFRIAILRLVGFGLLHAAIYLLLRRRLGRIQAWIERRADWVLDRYRRWSQTHSRGRLAAGTTFSLIVTLLLVPFVIQPTLVPLRFEARDWLARGANLLDGSASAAIMESAVGLYRKLYAEPVIAQGVTPEQYDDSMSAEPEPEPLPPDPRRPRPARPRPMMDRWDPLILQVVAGDRHAFATVKAFMWVESAGQQFAVSRTGCAGLMQFCSRTARSGGFRNIFGLGQVYPCRCNGRCIVPRHVRRDLESGDRRRLEQHRGAFVCDLTDARFDPHKSIAAGWLYIRELQRQLGGNLLLSYIGYNSGPAVARRLWQRIGRRADADLELIGRHLEQALEPNFGAAARRRARGLVRVHLPKLQRAYLSYR